MLRSSGSVFRRRKSNSNLSASRYFDGHLLLGSCSPTGLTDLPSRSPNPPKISSHALNLAYRLDFQYQQAKVSQTETLLSIAEQLKQKERQVSDEQRALDERKAKIDAIRRRLRCMSEEQKGP